MSRRHLGLVVGGGVGLVALGYVAGMVRAQGIPTMQPLVFTGYLTNNGQPVNNPAANLVVTLYPEGNTNNPQCASSSTPLPVVNGRFKVNLPDNCVTAVQNNTNLEAQVTLDGNEIARTRVNAVPYAVEAVRSGTALAAAGALDTRLRTLEGRSVVRVPHTGMDVDSGTALRNALASITDASAGRPYIIQLDAGVYDLGTTPLVMLPFVGLRGAERSLTILQSHGSTSDTLATITAADNAPLRDLTVRNLGGQAYSVGIFSQSVSVDLFQVVVSVDALNSAGRAYGLRLLSNLSSSIRESLVQVHGDNETQAIKVTGGALTITNTTLSARSNVNTAWGIIAETNANVDAFGVSIYALQGLSCTALDARASGTRISVRSSTLGASASPACTTSTAIYNPNTAAIGVVGSILGGAAGGAALCTGSVNASFGPLAANCQ